MKQLQRVAWILFLIVDVGYIGWGAGAAVSPEYLPGPGGKGILPAGYEGFSGGSWLELISTTPLTAAYIAVLYRMYGIYNVCFGLMSSAIAVTAFRRGEQWAWWILLVGNTIALASAITYDRMVNAIGPFELTEYLGLVLVWIASAVTAPFGAAEKPIPRIG
jgi:hypothetical protein